MTKTFAVTVVQEGDWFVASCAKVPGANGQGRTREEALKSLEDAVALLREDQAERVNFQFA